MKDIPILELGVLIEASRNRLYRESVYESFRVLIAFLQEHELTRRVLLSDPTRRPPDDFELYESDLTAMGTALVDTVVPRWFNWIEKGNPADNTSMLQKGLTKIRNSSRGMER